ncbi:MAG: rhodanese-like domain-containing protein [Halobacteria archaeon]|nr:rhodanese-like domain-containing protein [Halobacteria archaeon]
MVTEITPEELRDKIDSKEDFVIIDNRDEESFEGWHIKDAHNVEYSATYSELRGDFKGLKEELGLDENSEIVAVCAKGVASSAFADYLEERGYENVKNLRDGMEGWSRVYDIVTVPTRDDELEILQFQRRAKGCLSYLVGSKDTQEAAVIDPSRHVEKYEQIADEKGYNITHVFDTHIHADHISGGRDLANKVGAEYHLGKLAEKRDPQYEYDALERNQVIQVGDINIKAAYTPGHTTEMTSYLVSDEALMTGDTLFVESIGRTELEFTGQGAKEGAKTMYETLHKTVMSEPDSIKVLPGHFSITDSGETIDVTPGEPMYSTVGYLREKNRAIQLPKDDFVEYMFDNLPSKPPNYETVISTNLGKHAVESEEEATTLELGPNRCAASEESMVAND